MEQIKIDKKKRIVFMPKVSQSSLSVAVQIDVFTWVKVSQSGSEVRVIEPLFSVCMVQMDVCLLYMKNSRKQLLLFIF